MTDVADALARALLLAPGGQADFVLDMTSPFKVLVGGFGSGKTTGLVAAALVVGGINAPLPFLFVEPTFALIDDVALPAFQTILERAGIPYIWRSTKKRLVVGAGMPGAFEVWMRSGDKPEKIVGFEAGAGAIDEPGLQKSGIFKRVVQRCRHPQAKISQVMLGGTPESLNWFYNVAERRPPRGMRLYRARTVDNPFQTEQYIENLRATLSEQEIEAYMNGQFVNLTAGRVYRAFSASTHDAGPIDVREGEIVIGCDFNVAKMHWVLGQKRGDELVIFDEIVGTNTNTYRQTEALIDRLKEHWSKRERARLPADVIRSVHVYTDASGSARKTSANESDIQILRGAGFDVWPASSNPKIKDRVHSVEAKFRDGTITVDVEACPDLTLCLNGQVWDKTGMPMKGKGTEDLSSGTDALGYLVWGQAEWRATMPRGNQTTYESYR